jgi:hypothetical protein
MGVDNPLFTQWITASSLYAEMMVSSVYKDDYIETITNDEENMINVILHLPNAMYGFMKNEEFYDIVINKTLSTEVPVNPDDLDEGYTTVISYPYFDVMIADEDVMVKLLKDETYALGFIQDERIFKEIVKHTVYLKTIASSATILNLIYNDANLFNIINTSPLVLQSAATGINNVEKALYPNHCIILGISGANASYYTYLVGSYIIRQASASTTRSSIANVNTFDKQVIYVSAAVMLNSRGNATSYNGAIRYIPLV